MSLKLYNTLTQGKEEFTPREPGKVAMYVCGPTVYNYIHIGNARCYLVFDIIKRYLQFRGYDVYHVQNFTDIDDKIINRAAEEGILPEEVAKKYTAAFLDDMKLLQVIPPDVAPTATETVSDMIEAISILISKGFAYAVDGDVFYQVEKFPGYGKLSKRSLDEMRAGERVMVDERKRHPMDFALWKSAKPGEPWWESPWGKGRPGWHIECSVMSFKYLGASFDVHGGGMDLVFPHHENEIAQAEAYLGIEPFVRYWLHNGFVNMGSEKMAKSLGNVVLAKELIKEFGANAIRMFMCGTHYRSPISFGPERLTEAAAKFDRLMRLRQRVKYLKDHGTFVQSPLTTDSEREVLGFLNGFEERFIETMDDDFNAPAGIALIFEAVEKVNTFMDTMEKSNSLSYSVKDCIDKIDLIYEKIAAPIFGFDFAEQKVAETTGLSDVEIEDLLKEREKARMERRFDDADSIREKLTQNGITIDDTPLGSRWRRE